MRSFLALLLCLAVAFHGIGSVHAFELPCPAEQDKPAVTMDMSVAAGDCDCCNDADTAANTSEPCKTGQACKLPNSFAFASFQVLLYPPASNSLVPMVEPFTPSCDPADVWRPPTFS